MSSLFGNCFLLVVLLLLSLFVVVRTSSSIRSALRSQQSQQHLHHPLSGLRNLNREKFHAKDWVIDCLETTLDNRRWKAKLHQTITSTSDIDSSKKRVIDVLRSHHEDVAKKIRLSKEQKKKDESVISGSNTVPVPQLETMSARDGDVDNTHTFLLYLNTNHHVFASSVSVTFSSSSSATSPHRIIQSQLIQGEDHLYETLSNEYAIISLTWDEIETLIVSFPHVINDYLLLHTELKFTSLLSELGALVDEGLCSSVPLSNRRLVFDEENGRKKERESSLSMIDAMIKIKQKRRDSWMSLMKEAVPSSSLHSATTNDHEYEFVTPSESTGESSLHSLLAKGNKRKNKKSSSSLSSSIKLSFTFQTPALQEDYLLFTKQIQVLVNTFNEEHGADHAVASLSFEIDPIQDDADVSGDNKHPLQFKGNQRSIGSIRFTSTDSLSCGVVYEIAMSLATQFPQIAMLSLHEPLYTMNKFARELCSNGQYGTTTSTTSSSSSFDASSEPVEELLDESVSFSSTLNENKKVSSSNSKPSLRASMTTSSTATSTTMTSTTASIPTEVIGITDTGLDLFSCYFYDPNYITTSSSSTGSITYSNSYSYQTKLTKTILNTSHRKVIQYVSYVDTTDDADAHGTHVAGSVAGSVINTNLLSSSLKSVISSTAVDYNGMMTETVASSSGSSSSSSPQSSVIAMNKVAFYDIGRDDTGDLYTPDNINTGVFQVLLPSGARIFSNSWGSEESTYTELSQQSDWFMWKFPDTLLVYANGNSGASGVGTVTSPATAKNCLSVGASSSDRLYWQQRGFSFAGLTKESVAYFSSQGPTSDHRLKPDIVAPGYYITSAQGKDSPSSLHCSTKAMAGTSMGTPVVTGFVSQVRQYFLQGYYPTGISDSSTSKNDNDAFSPSGALLKAIMIHSGRAMSGMTSTTTYTAFSSSSSYPSNVQGYGRIVMDDILYFATTSSTSSKSTSSSTDDAVSTNPSTDPATTSSDSLNTDSFNDDAQIVTSNNQTHISSLFSSSLNKHVSSLSSTTTTKSMSSNSHRRLFVVGGAYANKDLHYVSFTSANETHLYTFLSLPSTTSSSPSTMRITLCYTDYPGSILSNKAMVNVLSLSVYTYNTTTGSKVVYTPYTTPYTVTSNVQVIDIVKPIPGVNYTVEIVCDRLSSASMTGSTGSGSSSSSSNGNYGQSYALVVTGEIHAWNQLPVIPNGYGQGERGSDSSNGGKETVWESIVKFGGNKEGEKVYGLTWTERLLILCLSGCFLVSLCIAIWYYYCGVNIQRKGAKGAYMLSSISNAPGERGRGGERGGGGTIELYASAAAANATSLVAVKTEVVQVLGGGNGEEEGDSGGVVVKGEKERQREKGMNDRAWSYYHDTLSASTSTSPKPIATSVSASSKALVSGGGFISMSSMTSSSLPPPRHPHHRDRDREREKDREGEIGSDSVVGKFSRTSSKNSTKDGTISTTTAMSSHSPSASSSAGQSRSASPAVTAMMHNNGSGGGGIVSSLSRTPSRSSSPGTISPSAITPTILSRGNSASSTTSNRGGVNVVSNLFVKQLSSGSNHSSTRDSHTGRESPSVTSSYNMNLGRSNSGSKVCALAIPYEELEQQQEHGEDQVRVVNGSRGGGGRGRGEEEFDRYRINAYVNSPGRKGGRDSGRRDTNSDDRMVMDEISDLSEYQYYGNH